MLNDATAHEDPTRPGDGQAAPATPKKATNAVILQRVEEVLVIRLDGAQLHDIRRYASENNWGVSDRQLERYIEKADRLLIERRQKKWGRMKAMHLARREALYAWALQAADYRTALAVLQDLAKLQDLYMDQTEIRHLLRQTRELTARLDELAPPDVTDPLVKYLAGLPTDDRARLAKLLKDRGYNTGPMPLVATNRNE